MEYKGMNGLILTCKHHDGFCLLPSKYTEHSIKTHLIRMGKVILCVKQQRRVRNMV